MKQEISSLREIITLYDIFLVDIWGVLHNGQQAFPEALEVLSLLQEENKYVCLLSNAPRRLEPAREKLEVLGIPPSLYQRLYTSGEECRRHLRARYPHQLGSYFFHIGPQRDRFLFEDLEFLREVQEPCKADFILVTGTWETGEDVLEDYEILLDQGVTAGRPMICANPDLVVRYQGDLALCSGALAKRYEEKGGQVFYHGKPYPEIYDYFFKEIAQDRSFQKSKILAIGDGLPTDIKGAQQAGIDSLLVLSGIHHQAWEGHQVNQEVLRQLCQKYGAYPRYVVQALQ